MILAGRAEQTDAPLGPAPTPYQMSHAPQLSE